jgi:NAD-dependent deacetylase
MYISVEAARARAGCVRLAAMEFEPSETANEAQKSPGFAQARSVLLEARRVTVLVGAGISTDSGIPDFRGPQGVWTKNPSAERTSNLSTYLEDPEVRRESWQQRLHSPAWSASPNAGHRALVDLERQGRLVALVTQNIDGLHQKAGNDPDRVLEVHGTMHRVVCWECGDEGPMEPALDRVRAGEADPHCVLCGGILKSATISFGQALDASTISRAQEASMSCDTFLVVGSSLAVYPAAGLVPLAADAGARVVIVNAEPTPFDSIAAAVVRGSISVELPGLLAPAGQAGRASVDA